MVGYLVLYDTQHFSNRSFVTKIFFFLRGRDWQNYNRLRIEFWSLYLSSVLILDANIFFPNRRPKAVSSRLQNNGWGGLQVPLFLARQDFPRVHRIWRREALVRDQSSSEFDRGVEFRILLLWLPCWTLTKALYILYFLQLDFHGTIFKWETHK